MSFFVLLTFLFYFMSGNKPALPKMNSNCGDREERACVCVCMWVWVSVEVSFSLRWGFKESHFESFHQLKKTFQKAVLDTLSTGKDVTLEGKKWKVDTPLIVSKVEGKLGTQRKKAFWTSGEAEKMAFLHFSHSSGRESRQRWTLALRIFGLSLCSPMFSSKTRGTWDQELWLTGLTRGKKCAWRGLIEMQITVHRECMHFGITDVSWSLYFHYIH